MKATQMQRYRLIRLAKKAQESRATLEKLSRDCCQAMGVDPDDTGFVSDTLKDIVFNGTDPDDALRSIEIHERRVWS